MKKFAYIFIVSLFLVSCETGNPLDPAKGIDSQGDTTLFSGKVTSGGVPVSAGVTVTCYMTDDNPLWTTETNSEGEYKARYDLSDLSSYYSTLRVAVLDGSGVEDTSYTSAYIYATETVDYDSERQSTFAPVIIRDLTKP